MRRLPVAGDLLQQAELFVLVLGAGEQLDEPVAGLAQGPRPQVGGGEGLGWVTYATDGERLGMGERLIFSTGGMSEEDDESSGGADEAAETILLAGLKGVRFQYLRLDGTEPFFNASLYLLNVCPADVTAAEMPDYVLNALDEPTCVVDNEIVMRFRESPMPCGSCRIRKAARTDL